MAELWRCAHCGADNRATWRVCDHCSTPRGALLKHEPVERPKRERDPDLAELAALATLPSLGPCRSHPERAGITTCERCGDYLCEGCIAVSDTGLCPSCAQALDSKNAPRGRFLVLSVIAMWGVLELRYLVRLFTEPTNQQSIIVAIVIAGLTIAGWLLYELYSGSEWVRQLLITLLGLGAVFGLLRGDMEAALVGGVGASLLLLPPVSAFIAVQERRGRQ